MLYKNAFKQLCSLSAAFLFVFFLAADFYAAPGDLDPSFGNGGIVISPFTQLSDEITSIQVQPDGKIIVSGHSYDYDDDGYQYVVSGFIARYNSSGTLDASFGSNGKIVTGDYYENVGGKTALQPDGKIVAIGNKITLNAAGTLISAVDFAVFRYNSNGTPDTSFGTGGKVFTSLGDGFANSRDVVLQPDGKIIVMGFMFVNGSGYKFVIARYNSDGSLDNNFGTSGKVVTAIASDFGPSSSVKSMLLQPDGKIVLVGGYNTDIFLVRYKPDGSLDSDFGTSGRVIHSLDGTNSGLDSVLQPDGKIVVAGYESGGSTSTLIVRYNADGSVDTSFATNGIFRTERGFFVGNSIALQPDGKILGFGNGILSPGVNSIAVARLNPNGSPDTSFGTNGRLITLVGTGGRSFGFAVALQADGKILGGGVTFYSEGYSDAVIVRYLGDSNTRRTQFDFDGDGKADVSVFRPSNGAWYLNQSTNGFTGMYFGLSTDKITPADYDGDGKTDLAVYRDGTWYLLRSQADFTAFQFGIASDIPAPADYDGDGKTNAAVYRDGNWYLRQSANGFSAVQFGLPTDKPVPTAFVP